MFRLSSSQPLEMKPVSYISKIKNLQGVAEDFDRRELLLDEISTSQNRNMRVDDEKQLTHIRSEPPNWQDDRARAIDESRQIRKIDIGLPTSRLQRERALKEQQEEITKKKDRIDTKTDKDYISEELDNLIDKRIKIYLSERDKKTIDAINKEERKKKDDNYNDLKKFVEQKLTSIDDIANYIKEQKQISLSESFMRKLDNIEKTVKENTSGTKISPKQQNEEEKNDFSDSRMGPVNMREMYDSSGIKGSQTINQSIVTPTFEDDKKLGKKRKSYGPVDDSTFNKIKNEYSSVKDSDRANFYSDGENYFVNINNRKRALNKKSIAAYEKTKQPEVKDTENKENEKVPSNSQDIKPAENEKKP